MSNADDGQKHGLPRITARPRAKYQVFVSSTFEDLHAEREAVVWAILKARHIPVGMENFSAAPEGAWETIKRVIDQSDYYVLILAGRYGSIDAETGLSWTHREYRYAIEKNVPVLAFRRTANKITEDKAEQDAGIRKKLGEFLEQVRQSHMIDHWEGDDLAGKVIVALTNRISDDEDRGHPRPGWFRGNEIALPSAKTLDEFARLSAENAELQDQIAKLLEAEESDLVLIDRAGQLIEGEIAYERNALQLGLLPPPKNWDFTFGPSDEELLGYVDLCNRLTWLELRVFNQGTGRAEDLVVDIEVEGADSVLIEKPEAPTGPSAAELLRAVSPDAPNNPNRHVYIDDHRSYGTSVAIRQRIKSIGPGGVEPLLGFGVTTEDYRDDAVFEVAFRIADSTGQKAAGRFRVSVRSNDVQAVRSEDVQEYGYRLVRFERAERPTAGRR